MATAKEKGRSVNSATVKAKPTKPMTIPVREVDGLESLALGFRMEQVACEHGGVYSGAGCGSPWIEVRWKKRTFCIHAVELLAAVVATFDPADAKLIGSAQSGSGIEVSAGSGG